MSSLLLKLELNAVFAFEIEFSYWGALILMVSELLRHHNGLWRIAVRTSELYAVLYMKTLSLSSVALYLY